MISLNERLLPKKSIAVFIDNKLVTDPAILEKCAGSIETTWNAKHSPFDSIADIRIDNPLRLSK